MLTSQEIISNTQSKEYSITRLSRDNLADVGKLYTEVYGSAPGIDYFAKKYDTAYTGVENVGFIAYNTDNMPVAYYGVIPCFIQFENEIILVAQSADTMTHPQHRYKGMFVELSNMTFDLCQQLGIRLIFGFPNQNSYPAMVNRLGWIETEKMSRFTVPVNTIWRRSFFQNKKKYDEGILNKLLLPQGGLGNSVIEDGYAGIYRDEAYYHYKTFENTYVIKTGSADVWIKITKELIIGDIILTGNSDKYFFEEIKTLAKKLNLNKISFQVCRGCRLHDLFATRYKAIPSFPVLFKDFGSGVPLKKIKFTFADIDIF
jgi:hypothetical protein